MTQIYAGAPLEPEGATVPKNKFGLGARRFRLAGSAS
jgi:hypothetical protein